MWSLLVRCCCECIPAKYRSEVQKIRCNYTNLPRSFDKFFEARHSLTSPAYDQESAFFLSRYFKKMNTVRDSNQHAPVTTPWHTHKTTKPSSNYFPRSSMNLVFSESYFKILWNLGKSFLEKINFFIRLSIKNWSKSTIRQKHFKTGFWLGLTWRESSGIPG